MTGNVQDIYPGISIKSLINDYSRISQGQWVSALQFYDTYVILCCNEYVSQQVGVA